MAYRIFTDHQGTITHFGQALYAYDKEGNLTERWKSRVAEFTSASEDPVGATTDDALETDAEDWNPGVYFVRLSNLEFNVAGQDPAELAKGLWVRFKLGDGTYYIDNLLNTVPIKLTDNGLAYDGEAKGVYAIHVDTDMFDDDTLTVEFRYMSTSLPATPVPFYKATVAVNLTRVETFEWDYRNRLTKATKYDLDENGSTPLQVPGKSTMLKATAVAGREYTYDVQNQLIKYVNADGTKLTTFIHERGQVVSRAQGSVRDVRLWGPGVDNLLADDGGTTTWAFTDQQGTVTHAMQSGNASEISYDPFGKPTFDDPTFGIETFYAGREYDPFTGFYNNRARNYDPVTSRFISEDPINADINTYRYAGNSFANATDPTGEFISWAAAGVGAGVGAVAGLVIEVGVAAYTGREITVGSLLGAATAGAIAGAVTGAAAGALTGDVSAIIVIGGTLAAGAAGGGAGGFAGSVVRQSTDSFIDTGSVQVDFSQARTEAVYGAIGGAAGAGVGLGLSRLGSAVAANGGGFIDGVARGFQISFGTLSGRTGGAVALAGGGAISRGFAAAGSAVARHGVAAGGSLGANFLLSQRFGGGRGQIDLDGNGISVRPVSDLARRQRGQKHHIASNKSKQFRPLFEDLFRPAGLDLDSAFNRVRIPGHVGPHGASVNQIIFRRLEIAVAGKSGEAYRKALIEELLELRYLLKNTDLGDLLRASASRIDL